MSNDKRLYLSRIFKAYNVTKAHARRAGDLKRVDRLDRALGVLLSSHYYQNEKSTYQASVSSCSCKDWQYRRAAHRGFTGPCKHMLSEQILRIALTSTGELFDNSLNCSTLNIVGIETTELGKAGVYRPA